MGYPATEHASILEVQEAIARVLAACKAAGKFAGMVSISLSLASLSLSSRLRHRMADPLWLLSSARRPSKSRRALSKDVGTLSSRLDSWLIFLTLTVDIMNLGADGKRHKADFRRKLG